MDGVLRQAGRLGRLTTALGGDELVLLRFDGSDHLNALFDYRVEALSSRDNLNFDALLGTHATVEIEGRDGPRYFDGVVTQICWAGASENGYRYNLKLEPWLALAGKRRNMRIWHGKTVEQLLKELFVDYMGLGDPAFEIRLANDYPVREFTVQYGETDLDFARRQMERHGISFFFRHEAGNHTCVITDDELNLKLIGEREFKPADGHHQADGEHFWEWRPERNVTTGAVRAVDYDFKRPTQIMETEHLGDAVHPNGKILSYDWPGDYLDQETGKPITRMRTRRERGADRRIRAVGDCVGLSSGYRAKLTGDKVPGHGETFICLSATHSFVSEAYGSGGQGSDGYAFTGSYVLMPDTAPMVPPKRTPLSRVYGPQTAVVVGKSEIDCDEFGRILVQFHWDLDKVYSMRCRVSQNWAGQGWGGMVVPRVGMEVVVEFLEGDPDKPLVTGCVYNGMAPPPMSLPAARTRSVFKTNSVGGKGFNELSFEDKSGEEFIYMHAQKNLDVHVNNSRQLRVEYDDNQTIGNNSNLAVAANRTETIKGKRDLTVNGDMSHKVDGDMGITVGGDISTISNGDLHLSASGEIVINASRITLVSKGAALVVEGGVVNVAPILNVGAASPGAVALPAIPAVLEAAAGEGMPFVSHCPKQDTT